MGAGKSGFDGGTVIGADGVPGRCTVRSKDKRGKAVPALDRALSLPLDKCLRLEYGDRAEAKRASTLLRSTKGKYAERYGGIEIAQRGNLVFLFGGGAE